MIVEVQHMEELLKQIGTRIRTRRKQLRLSQEQLAEMAGITPQTVSTAELGQKAMRPETTIRICEALEISTDYLLLGKITADDQSVLCHKLSQLSPNQYRYLENIINSYIAAVTE